jgi:signal transduction histidine kinase
MRSVYFKALLLSFGILMFSLAGFLVISRVVTYREFGKDTPIGRNAALQFEEASLEYENGGAGALASYLNWQRKFYPRLKFYFTRSGRDLVTGQDRTILLNMARSKWKFLTVASPLIVAVPSATSVDAFIAELPPQNSIFFLDYYLLLFAAVVFLCWGLAIQFASPLHRLAETVRRFGAGDLGARVHSNRQDAIGEVSRAFDQMAGRMEMLLLAERRLLQDISHELRSPLARLSFAAELARTSPDRDAAAVRVNQEIDRLTDLVQSLLQVTREDGDLPARRLETTSLDGLVTEVVRDCQIEAAARNCELEISKSAGAELLGDPVLLRRAIENIVRNAIGHAPAGTSVELTLETFGENASIVVRDYGPGVPEEALTQIFKPFFRVDTSRNADSGGVGLGLAITQRAITAHNGHVWAENAHPGLRICIELSLVQSSENVRTDLIHARAGNGRTDGPAIHYEIEPGAIKSAK